MINLPREFNIDQSKKYHNIDLIRVVGYDETCFQTKIKLVNHSDGNNEIILYNEIQQYKANLCSQKDCNVEIALQFRNIESFNIYRETAIYDVAYNGHFLYKSSRQQSFYTEEFTVNAELGFIPRIPSATMSTRKTDDNFNVDVAISSTDVSMGGKLFYIVTITIPAGVTVDPVNSNIFLYSGSQKFPVPSDNYQLVQIGNDYQLTIDYVIVGEFNTIKVVFDPYVLI